jgi:invasion protein IalB
MGSFTRIGARRVLMASCAVAVLLSGAALYFYPLSSGVAQTAQEKQPTPGAATETPTQPAPGQAAPPQPTWAMNCGNTPQGLDCRAVQSLFLKNTGQRLLSVVVHVPADTKKPVLLMQLPLGVYLPSGATLQIGKSEAKSVAFKSCDQFGCIAEYPITEAEIAAISKGSDLTITMQNLRKEPVTVTVPSLGFAAAYAKVK